MLDPDRTSTVLGWFAGGLTALAALAPVLGAQPGDSPASAPHRLLVEQFCAGCHNAAARVADLALDGISAQPVEENRLVWEKAVRKLRGRQMPPVGTPRPDEATYVATVAWLEERLDHAASREPDPGRTDTFRRLTRTEYRNAIRDILALDVDLSEVLPRDESSSGFDNITLGTLSPALLEGYVAAADRISRLAIGRPVEFPEVVAVRRKPDLTQEWQMDGLPVGTRGGAVLRHTFPLDAEYEIVITLARDRDEQVEGLRVPHHVELLLDDERMRLFEVAPPRHVGNHAMVDKHLTARMRVSAGPHTVGVTFPKKPWAVLETDRQPYQAHYNLYRHPRIQPAVYEIAVRGPFDATGPGSTPSRDRVFVCRPEASAVEDDCVSRILTGLMRRAYRREITGEDLESPLEFYRQGRSEAGVEAGIEMALSAILVSPNFLFRVERDPAGIAPGAPYRISNTELASRLSFFLWSSVPDPELLDLAARRRLSRPDVLEAQVLRMLADRRSDALVANFAAQWLHLRNLASAKPDLRLFPSFDDNLRQAMRHGRRNCSWRASSGKTAVSLDSAVLRLHVPQRAPCQALWDSTRIWQLVPQGDGWTRRASRRGGILRHGSVLTVTSYSTRTSPVIRGHWVLESLMGVPPPPPPAEVPALDEKTIAERPVGERATDGASRESRLRWLSQPDGSAGLRARAL